MSDVGDVGARARLAACLDDLRGVRVLVVGDVMLDRFVHGEAERISPEAPVPVLRITRQDAMVGGAGNVVRNLVALGAEAAFVSVIGNDDAGREIRARCKDLPGIDPEFLVEVGRPTSIKSRYFAAGQQLLRTDEESTAALAGETEIAILDHARKMLGDCACVVLSDYGKGVLSEAVIAGLIGAASKAKKPVLVDPKGTDYGRYRGARLITPNRRELAEATRKPTVSDKEVGLAAFEIVESCGVDAVIATRGAEGMTLVTADRRGKHLKIAAEAREVFDVSGAGDTVIAVLAAALGGGVPLIDAARLANVAAGIVVGKTGTAVAGAGEIAAALYRQDLLAGEGKLVERQALIDRVVSWRRKRLQIGFTNGCFDLLHPGHIALLAKARGACDRLVVALNSDESARRLKGDGRPVQSAGDRAAVLASLASVDALVIFGEDTPLALIEAVRPDVLVKGADYTRAEVVGGDLVESHGGRVLLVELERGHSTSATIAKLAR